MALLLIVLYQDNPASAFPAWLLFMLTLSIDNIHLFMINTNDKWEVNSTLPDLLLTS